MNEMDLKDEDKDPVKDFSHTPLSQIGWRTYLASKNYETDINEMCGNCIANQIEEHGYQAIECRGLASASMLIDDSVKHMFSEDDLDTAEQLANPYYWAQQNINKKKFTSRWYQEMTSRCTAKRLTLRCGRRSGKSYSLALKMLHRALMTECKVLIVTPYEIQAEELMNLMIELLYALDPDYGTYNSLVDKFVKSPTYLMKFHNGSRIRAFTTGSSGAGSVRGQAADVIILDEVDYMSEADFNSILAILADNPDVELWVASTPNGKAQLYRLENLEEYRSFHFPSYVLPHYNDKLDREFKGQFTDIGYIQEVMAEFGEADATVFQGYFIDKSVAIPAPSREDVLANRDKYIVILGGDWNDDKNGTRLLAVAFDKIEKHFFVCDRRRISKEGWTQVAAVQEVISFNRQYRFEHVYLDEGYGVSNIQFIRQYALDQRGVLPQGHPDIRLSEIVGVNFSSKVEVLPPDGGEPIKKDMKTYLVENSVRLLERDVVKFDKVYDKSLMEQMRNYVILRRSPSGKPIYGTTDTKVGDHDLDAFMLALLGWSMEYSSMLNHATSDVLVKLVSRAEMDGVETTDNMIANGLFASEITTKSAPKLFKERINRYNRASFNKDNSGAIGRLIPVAGRSSRDVLKKARGSTGRSTF